MSEDAPTDERRDSSDPEREDADAAADDGSPDRDATDGVDREPSGDPARSEADSGGSRQVVDAARTSPDEDEQSAGSRDGRPAGGTGVGSTTRPGATGPTETVEDRPGAPGGGQAESVESGSVDSGWADSGEPEPPGDDAGPDADDGGPDSDAEADSADAQPGVPQDVRSYDRFQKVDRASYDRVNEFLRDRTYITAREWAIARLCADFRTATGVEMTKIGENLPHLVPFMTDTYSPQAVNQARSAFEEKVRMAGATFLYGAMSGFFTADELDDLMYEVTEVAKFLLEVEGVELTVEEELDAEDRISAVMREVRQASEELRYDEVACPHCGEAFEPGEHEH